MKIAIIGATDADSIESNLEEAFSHAGHEARIFDIYDGRSFHLPRLGVYTRVLDKIGRTYSDSYDRKVFHRLFQRVLPFSPELVVCVYRFIHPEFVASCKRQGYKTIHVNPDALTTFGFQQVFSSPYDAWFTKDPYIVRFMRDNLHLNVFRYNEAFNIRRHVKPSMPKLEYEKKYNIDVMTYGTLYPYRAKMLEAVAAAGINLNIYGIIPHRFYQHNLDSYFQNKYLTGKEKAETLYGAKIVFNQMHYAEIESVNNRFFEVNGSGAFQLSDYRPILQELLPVDPELVSFRNINEGIEKIRYYLQHPEERAQIAEKVYSHFVQHYTYDHLVDYILSKIA